MQIIQSIKERANQNRIKNISNKNRIFSKESGENKFEENLAKILKPIFSEYMVFINPHREKGYELCDALIIFKNYILIFSDKGTDNFNDLSDKIIEKTWKNYYDTLKKSEQQLLEAKTWIEKNIIDTRLSFFVDKECSQVLNISVSENPVFFLISSLSGLSQVGVEMCNNDGTLPIDHSNKQNNKKLFSTINKIVDNNFIHAFDINSLMQIFSYLDTPFDFINYLIYRERILKQEQNFILQREDQILFLYALQDCELGTITYDINEIDFLTKNPNLYKELDNIDFFQTRIMYGQKSKLIDDLLTNFAYEGNQSNSGLNIENDNDEQYRINFTYFLELNRRERIALYLDLIQVLDEAKLKKSSSLYQGIFKKCFFLVSSFYRKPEENATEYRNRRVRSALNAIKKLSNKNDLNIDRAIILFLDHPLCIATHSEDLFYFNDTKDLKINTDSL